MDDPKSLADEQWREYDFNGRTYRIDNPVSLYVGKTTHRVLTMDGIIHCLPAPGQLGCVLRWKCHNAANPVQF